MLDTSRIAFIDLLDALLPSSLDANIAQAEARMFGNADIVVAKVHEDLVAALRNPDYDELYDVMIRRLRNRPLFLLYFSRHQAKHSLVEVSPQSKLVEIEPGDQLAQLRNRDIGRIVIPAKERSVYKHDQFTFVAPSGRHCDTFFRVGNLLTSAHEIANISFWVLPWFVNADAILLDTWSIAAIPHWMGMYMGSTPTVAGFARHPFADSRGAQETVFGLRERVGSDSNLLCLTSVASTGRYQELIEVLTKRAGWNSRLVVDLPIFAMADSEEKGRSLYVVDEVACRSPLADLQNRPRVPIDPALFMPRESPEKSTPLKWDDFGIKKVTSQKFVELPGCRRTLIEAYNQHPGALGVHRTYEGNHFAFFVDMEVVTKTSDFKSRLVAKSGELLECGVPDVVLYSTGAASESIAHVLGEKFGIPVLSTRAENLREVLDSRTVLYAKEAVATGERLTTEGINLRSMGFRPRAVTYCVGLDRIGSLREAERVRAILADGSPWPINIVCVDHLRLDNMTCPWCGERDFLERARDTYPKAPDWLRNRYVRLTDPSGLCDSVLSGSFLSQPTVGTGSVVFPEGWSPLPVLFYMAVALQHLRMEREVGERLQPSYGDSTVLSYGCLRQYNEPMLQACLLRVVLPEEWGITQQPRIAARIRRTLDSVDSPILAFESAVAIGKGAILPAASELMADSIAESLADLLGSSTDPIDFTNSAAL